MKRKKRKLKLKKQAYFLFAGVVAVIVISILGFNFYKRIEYQQTDEYKLIEKGYTLEQATILQGKLSSEEIANILGKDKNDTIVDLVNEKYFLSKNLDTYLEYHEEEAELSLSDVVAAVNVHAYQNWYETILDSDPSLNERVNVNKFYALSSDYTPENLKNISLDYSYGNEGDNKLVDYAYDAFIDLWDAAHEEGFYLMVNSSYRDYASQEAVYNDYKTSLGERRANEIAARPGHSEHQTGLVVDMTSTTEPNAESFSDSEAYKWLQKHAHEYGWIERYPEDKTYITGYSPESWHWRYVGKDVAKVIHDEGITYDEYYAFYIEGNQ